MAQTTHSGIVDLTGEDDHDNSIARANAACEKAFAAASRLTNHFESLKNPIPYKDPNDRVDLIETTPLSAIDSNPLVPPRVGIFPNPARIETNGLEKNERDNAIQGLDCLVSSPDVTFSRSALVTAATRPAKSPSLLDRIEGKKQQPRVTTSVPSGAGTPTIRTQRLAAVSAKHNIAETCSELEEWVNKDPNLVLQQPGVSTPRKSGRPRKDADEWSPTSNTKRSVEEQRGQGRIIAYSPTPSAGRHGDLTANEGSSLSSVKEKSISLGKKKRKHSGSPLSRDYPVKLARWNDEQSAHHDSTASNSAESADRKLLQNEIGKSSPGGCFPRCVFPAIKAAKADHKQSLTEDELTEIGKSVSLLVESQAEISYA